MPPGFKGVYCTECYRDMRTQNPEEPTGVGRTGTALGEGSGVMGGRLAVRRGAEVWSQAWAAMHRPAWGSWVFV